MSVDVELARQQWREGSRRLEALRGEDRGLHRALLLQVEIVTAELRARIGQTFTLQELAEAYPRAEIWVRDAVSEAEPPAGWPRHLSVVSDAAFHEYARGALDYEP